jgi:hypothetical protein
MNIMGWIGYRYYPQSPELHPAPKRVFDVLAIEGGRLDVIPTNVHSRDR